MSIPLSKTITPLHHLHHSPSLPVPLTATLSFTRLPLSLKPKRLTQTTTTKTSAASTTQPTLNLDSDEDQAEKIKEDDNNTKERWREIHGERDWEGLLDPMDPLLKSEVIRYGDMAQACYDAFDYDKTSRYCGSCKYCPENFFSDLGLQDTGYDVTRYLYATGSNALANFFSRATVGKSWSLKANWIGFVAVSDDETTRRIGRRDIVVAWRGTVTKLEWMADITDYLVQFPGHPKSGMKVESGFLGLYTEREKECACKFSHYSAREQVLAEVGRLIRHYSSKKSVSTSIYT